MSKIDNSHVSHVTEANTNQYTYEYTAKFRMFFFCVNEGIKEIYCSKTWVSTFLFRENMMIYEAEAKLMAELTHGFTIDSVTVVQCKREKLAEIRFFDDPKKEKENG